MATVDLGDALPTLLSELVHGVPAPRVESYMLNLGDEGLLGSLSHVSAMAASKAVHGGGTIAAHADHLRYGLSLLNRWAAGERDPWKQADWTASWRRATVDDDAWRALRADLAREADAWIAALGAIDTRRDLTDHQITWAIGSIAHLAYHLGAIRQIDRAARGPTAEDERAYKSAHGA
jgi:hypothetical protein